MYSKFNPPARRPLGSSMSHMSGHMAEGDHPPTRAVPLGRPSYHQKVRVPPGYNGHAIVNGEERPFGESETAAEPLLYVDDAERGSLPEPRFDDLPRVSELAIPRHSSGLRTLADVADPLGEPSSESPSAAMRTCDAPPESPGPTQTTDAEPGTGTAPASSPAILQPALPSTRVFSLFDATHFPFGHGFGFDEILLLGLILFLLHENPRDGAGNAGDLDETLILLGILLLCG